MPFCCGNASSVAQRAQNKDALHCASPLPRRLPTELLNSVKQFTRLTDIEVGSLYERFRRLAPSGAMCFSVFRGTMGMLGMLDDLFLARCMFQAFDTNGDNYLDFVEFSVALGTMIKGEDDEKLALAFRILRSPRKIQGSQNPGKVVDKTEALGIGEHSQVAARENFLKEEEGITLFQFRNVVVSLELTRRQLIGPLSKSIGSELTETVFFQVCSRRAADGVPVITLEDFKNAVRTHPEFLSLLGVTVGPQDCYRQSSSVAGLLASDEIPFSYVANKCRNAHKSLCRRMSDTVAYQSGLKLCETSLTPERTSDSSQDENLFSAFPNDAPGSQSSSLETLNPTRSIVTSEIGTSTLPRCAATETTAVSRASSFTHQKANNTLSLNTASHCQNTTLCGSAAARASGGSHLSTKPSQAFGSQDFPRSVVQKLESLHAELYRTLMMANRHPDTDEPLVTFPVEDVRNTGEFGCGKQSGEAVLCSNCVQSTQVANPKRLSVLSEDSRPSIDLTALEIPEWCSGVTAQLQKSTPDAEENSHDTGALSKASFSESGLRHLMLVIERVLYQLRSPAEETGDLGATQHCLPSALPGGNNAASLILSCDPDCSSLSLFEPFLKSWGSGGLICRAQQDSTLPSRHCYGLPYFPRMYMNRPNFEHDAKQKQKSFVHLQSIIQRSRPEYKLLGPSKGFAVHFGHPSWNTVLNMMVGIRLAGGRTNNEPRRAIEAYDFVMKEKMSILPRSQEAEAVRFVDYAPMVFRKIREFFGLSAEDYLRSIGPEQLVGNMVLGNLASLSELCSEGKSGAFFYYTADGKFLIKTITRDAARFLKSILKDYYRHILNNPDTLITRFYGFHSMRSRKTPGTAAAKLYFVIMYNFFHTPVEIHRRYDLKGSWVGRTAGQAAEADPTIAWKDYDMLEREEKIALGPDRRKMLLQVIQRDADFFSSHMILDYSLLIGIHQKLVPAPRLQTQEPDSHRHAFRIIGSISEPFLDVSGDMDSASAQMLPSSYVPRPAFLPCRKPFHQRDLGGLASSDGTRLYYLGIVDILTRWTPLKRLEHSFKAIHSKDCGRGVSCAHPSFYAQKQFLDRLGHSLNKLSSFT